VDANLRGFSAGFAAASAGSRPPAAAPPRPHAPSPALADLECEIATMPAAAQAVMIEGVRRLAAYQDVAYARLYLDRLNPLRDADAKAGAAGRLLAAVARQLALRMSYEDVIRVAQAKIDPARLTRIVREMDVRPGQTLAITEYLKPGLDEFCSILPGFLARGLLAVAARFPALARARWGMAINSRSISGYLRFALLAKLRPWRATFRFQQEQEVVRQAIDAVTSARTAASLDPEGEALAKCLAALAQAPVHAIAAE
jgi:indolepyruvate ferredoxin oxidoreductase, beta subunit